MGFSRREFLTTTALGSLALGLEGRALENTHGVLGENSAPQQSGSGVGKKPIIVCANNGFAYLDRAFDHISKGGDTLDSAVLVVTGPEDDPKDDSVGLGGLPNEEGVVELDACCMHGPTRRAGSVGGVRNIKNVSMVARAVMEHTGHVMLVGEGATRFATTMGFPKENLLTERSRKIWLLWKEYNSDRDWWGPGMADPHWHPPAPQSAPQAQVWQDRIDQLHQRAAHLGIEPEF